MLHPLVDALASCHGEGAAVIEVGRLERLPDVFYCHVARVYHVAGIKAVVAQVVEHDFVGREIVAVVAMVGDGLVDGDAQCGFAQRVGAQSICYVAYRAYSEDDAQLGIELVQNGEHFVQHLRHLGDA